MVRINKEFERPALKVVRTLTKRPQSEIPLKTWLEQKFPKNDDRELAYECLKDIVAQGKFVSVGNWFVDSGFGRNEEHHIHPKVEIVPVIKKIGMMLLDEFLSESVAWKKEQERFASR